MKIATLKCHFCGKDIVGPEYVIKRRKFCSRKCAGFSKRIESYRDTRPNNYRYREWRIAVLKRDGGRCRWCDLEGIKTYKNLEIHHIIPVSIAPEKQYEVSNGITLCHEHHRLIYGKEQEYSELLANIINNPLITRPEKGSLKHGPICVTQEELYNLYWEEMLSLKEIGAIYGVTQQCIAKYMDKYGIKRRNRREGQMLALRKKVIECQ